MNPVRDCRLPTDGVLTHVSSRSDQRLLNVIVQHGLSETDVRSIVQRWLHERTTHQTLTNFLALAGFLQPLAPQILSMNWGDGLLLAGTEDLFTRDGIDSLRQWLRSPSTPTPRPIVTLPEVDDQPDDMPKTAPKKTAVKTELTRGQVLGRCVIVGRLAQGSFGTVYRALHRTLNVPVAVKVLHPDLIDSDSPAADQFRAEALMLARLNHPNVVRVWDFDDSVAPPYIVLEFVEGMNLAEMIARRGAVRLDLAVKAVLQVIDGLEAANQHGIVHQDIKPANILLTRDENAKVADLGLAVVIGRHRAIGQRASQNGPAMAGTVAYLAPEQAGAGGKVDHRADIYSLGATFYHMVTGQLPFQGRTPLIVLMKHANEPVRPPHLVMHNFDRGLSDVIVKMMCKNPDERFRNYDELREALIEADIALTASAMNL